MTALIGLLVYPLVMLLLIVFLKAALQDYLSLFNTLLLVLGSIVGAYMGLSTWYERQ